jgi:hypothetical protein
MKSWYDHTIRFLNDNRDDLEFLLFVGLPGGILFIILCADWDYLRIF